MSLPFASESTKLAGATLTTVPDGAVFEAVDVAAAVGWAVAIAVAAGVAVAGRSTWENLACACPECNGRKRDRTPAQAQMPLRRPAREPFHIPFIVIKRNTAHDEWSKYLTLYSVGIEERVR